MVANVASWAGRTLLNYIFTSNAYHANCSYFLQWGYPGGTGGPTNTALISDVNLFQPGLESRAAATTGLASANQLGDTIVFTGTITATGTRTINEVGLFESSSQSPTGTTNTTAANSSQTAVGLIGAGAANLVSSGTYLAQWDNEIVYVSSGAGSNSLTIVRGQLGSTAAAHNASVPFTAGGDGGAHAANSSIGSATWVPTGANGGSIIAHCDFANIGLNINDSIAFTLKTQLS